MPDPTLIQKDQKYAYSGYFDPKQVYDFCIEYLKVNKSYTIKEREYQETNNPKEMRIFAIVDGEQEYTDYFKKVILLVVTMGGKKVEVMVNGKKTKLVEGSASLKVSGNLEVDYLEKRYEGNLFRKYISHIYDKYFGGDEMDKCVKDFENDIKELIEKFKQALNSDTYKVKK